jgi:hypothetical protein
MAALKKGQPREYILWLCYAQPQYIGSFSLLNRLFSVESKIDLPAVKQWLGNAIVAQKALYETSEVSVLQF